MIEKVESKILTLRKVHPSDLDAVREYREEFLEKGGTMDGCSNLRRFENMADWYYSPFNSGAKENVLTIKCD